MRELSVKEITKAIRWLCIDANLYLPPDLAGLIKKAECHEQFPLGKEILSDLIKNLDAADELQVPICQDTGIAVVFLSIGQELHLTEGDLTEAVNEGVRQGYIDGNLRCSVVGDPLFRENTGDNTPAVLHVSIVPGDNIIITVAPKGFGSENMSRIKMFNPNTSPCEIIGFVCDTVKSGGGNPCPPLVIGVGIGGDFELSAFLAKKALCRSVSLRNPDSRYEALELEILREVNKLQIGVQGFGGDTTALCVNIEQYPTHIAGLPVAVNIGCHVTRHKTTIL